MAAEEGGGLTGPAGGPRVVIGIPTFNKARWLGEALESLLGQTYRELALVVVDDGSSDGTVALARELAGRDPRLQVFVNPSRLGMLGNTNRALELPRELFPEAPYLALGSDHDVWDPRWLSSLVALLDADPGVVLAYPLTRRIDEDGVEYPGQKPPWRLDTRGMAAPRARMRHAFRRMAAGDMIYGVFRAAALERVGGYRPVLVPDRLLLSELALHGTFAQAPEVLWRRRFRGLASLDRQRAAFFLDGEPPWIGLPWWLQHTGAIAWDYGVRGKGARLGLGRAGGLGPGGRVPRGLAAPSGVAARAAGARARAARAKRAARAAGARAVEHARGSPARARRRAPRAAHRRGRARAPHGRAAARAAGELGRTGRRPRAGAGRPGALTAGDRGGRRAPVRGADRRFAPGGAAR